MAEYIEREALLDAIINDHPDLIFYSKREAIECIVAEPAADVAPVRHGRWVFDGSDFADIWKCSACGDDWYFEYDPRDAETLVNYCPNCGAKMDLEGGDGA